MRQILSQVITSDDLELYLNGASDFQFETEIIRSCLERGFHAEHAGTYVDPVTGKDRQFDIRARFTKQQFGNQRCTLKLAVECKNLRTNFPLLVSCVPRRTQESYHDAILSCVVRKKLSQNASEGCISVTNLVTEASEFRFTNGSLFLPDEPVGKATVQVGRVKAQQGKPEFISNDDEVHDGWAQAVSSSHDLIKESVKECSLEEMGVIVTVVQPVLVVANDTLWTIKYDASGKKMDKPQRVQECHFYLGKRFPTLVNGKDYRLSHLIICTKAGFDSLLNKIAFPGVEGNSELWNRLFPDLSIRDFHKELSTRHPSGNGVSLTLKNA